MKEASRLNREKIGSIMREKRLELGLKKSDISMKTGISSRYYGSIENGKNSPSLDTLNRISKALGVSLLFLLNDRMADMEYREREEEERLKELFGNISTEKIQLVDGLITQAARLRILLDDNWKDIIENGEYEKFKQSENQLAYDRKRPIVESYDNRDKTYQSIIKQLTDLLPRGPKQDKKNKLLGRK
ncbi:helix-turn-helix transcriptional regulator [Enterococcus hirae]|nr:helix-turn-helix transcriptional regulator [Enterococcus hirae]